LVDEIYNGTTTDILFGHGFMSERTYLSQLPLSWAIDAHSNVLQSLYGVGAFGLLLMFSIYIHLHFIYKKAAIVLTQYSTLMYFFRIFNLSFILFGLTSSHYFSRPSVSAIFITSFVVLVSSLCYKEKVIYQDNNKY